jgi:hypothetical protein
MWWIPLAMAGAGAIKGQKEEAQAKRDRQMEAEIARWSPWTGMQPQRVHDGPGVMGNAIQGATSGLSMMQNVNALRGGKSDPVAPKAPPPGVAPENTALAGQAGFYPQANPAEYDNRNAFGQDISWMDMKTGPQRNYMVASR